MNNFSESEGPPATPLPQADELLAMCVHELRSPVAAIVGFAETIRDRRDEMTTVEVDEALDAISRQAGRLDGLLHDLLVVAAGRAGSLELRPERVVLGDAISRVLSDDTLGDPAIVVDCDPALTAMVDPARLHQMLSNYISNARLHGKPPWRIGVTRTDEGIEVAVYDGGEGVANVHQARLFSRFHRAGGRDLSGSGLGLAVVKSLATASGGRAYYDPGRAGTHRFVLVLPAAEDDR